VADEGNFQLPLGVNNQLAEPQKDQQQPIEGLPNIYPGAARPEPVGRPTGFSDAICNFNSHVYGNLVRCHLRPVESLYLDRLIALFS
jgi:hypothetical protein